MCIVIEAKPTPDFVKELFAAWKEGKSVFAVNPKIPHIPKIEYAPPHSLLLMTSGSTGTPKIAVLSMEALLANAQDAIKAVDLRFQDKWKLTLPLYHVGGIGILLRCYLAGAKVCYEDDPDITHLSYVPTHLYRMSPVYRKLRCLLLGGAPIPQIKSPLPIYTTYGLTEMGSMVTLNGDVLPHAEVMLAPDGEILVKGASLFTQYLNEPLHAGWFATKDLGKWVDGKLEIVGRKDWMFISGGENIQPEEIEMHLLSIDGVIDAAVVAKEDPQYGKRPIAVVSSQKIFDLAHLHAILRVHLPKYKLPIELHFLPYIPKKSNGKIDRFILLQLINSK